MITFTNMSDEEFYNYCYPTFEKFLYDKVSMESIDIYDVSDIIQELHCMYLSVLKRVKNGTFKKPTDLFYWVYVNMSKQYNEFLRKLNKRLLNKDNLSKYTALIETDNNIEDIFEQELVSKNLRNLINESLPNREALVLLLRFSLDDEQWRTLEEVAQIFGITNGRIKQIEKKAIIHLRKELFKRAYNPNIAIYKNDLDAIKNSDNVLYNII